jgi:adenylate kinase
MRPLRGLLLGMPGVGKGTYAKHICAKLSIPHISTGDAFRKHIATHTEIGKNIQQTIQQGKLVQDHTVMQVLSEEIGNFKGFLLDGIPRNSMQIPLLDELLRAKNLKLDFALVLELAEDLLVEKICARRSCAKCGHGYNLAHIEDKERGVFMPALLPKVSGVCDSCGHSPLELIKRDDDNEIVARERIRLHKELSDPVEEEYAKRGILHRFPLTSGVESMWPKMDKFIDENVIKKLV